MKTRMFLMSLGLALGVAVLSTATNHGSTSVADAQQPSPIPSGIPSPMSTVSPMASGMMMSPAPRKT